MNAVPRADPRDHDELGAVLEHGRSRSRSRAPAPSRLCHTDPSTKDAARN